MWRIEGRFLCDQIVNCIPIQFTKLLYVILYNFIVFSSNVTDLFESSVELSYTIFFTFTIIGVLEQVNIRKALFKDTHISNIKIKQKGEKLIM